MAKSKRGDSRVQRDAEVVIRTALEQELGCTLTDNPPARIGSIQLDGFCDTRPPVCVEIWAHQGRAKSAQQNKLMKDMCKMLLVEKKLRRKCRKIIVVSDREAVAHLDHSWQGGFAEKFGIEIRVVTISPALRLRIVREQAKQYR